MPRCVPVLMSALALLSAACGSSAGPVTAPSGALVFAHSCAACHSLIGNESRHKQGGDLVGYHLSRAQLTLMTRSMPTGRLSPPELSAVVGYVLRTQDEPVGGSG